MDGIVKDISAGLVAGVVVGLAVFLIDGEITNPDIAVAVAAGVTPGLISWWRSSKQSEEGD